LLKTQWKTPCVRERKAWGDPDRTTRQTDGWGIQPPPEIRNPDRPNILLIITDEQHWRMMSCAGNEHVRTPAMDSLAANGVRFERAYCTNPTCVPSRMSMFLGLMPSQMNMVGNPSEYCLMSDQMRRDSLGWLMQYAGYRTAYAGKTHLSLANTPAGLGFEEYLTHDQRDICAEESARFIRQEHDKPFFLVTSLINPHDIGFMAMRDYSRMPGYEMSPKVKGFLSKGQDKLAEVDRALRRPEGVEEEEFINRLCPPLPENFEPADEEPEAIGRWMAEGGFCHEAIRAQWSPERWREYRWAYARLTQRVDDQIGLVLDALGQSGKEDNTLVVFLSDHGDNDAARRAIGKNLPYDESMRVPFIVSRKGMDRASQTDQRLVSSGLDLIPTLCDYAGIDPPATCRGRSVRPLVEGLNVPWRDHLVVETQIARTILKGPWQYITFCSGANQEQLFHLESDPLAMDNRIKDPQNRDVVDSLRAALSEHCEQIDDQVGLEMMERSDQWKGLPVDLQKKAAEQAQTQGAPRE
jgi:choline-sulfatase